MIPFFTDQNVADSVGRCIQEAGHLLTRLRDVMATNTPDQVIAVACSRSGQVLVSHDRDFRAISKRLQIDQRSYRETLHRIDLRCDEPDAARRMRTLMPLVEREYQDAIDGAYQLVIEIREKSVVIRR